MSNLKLEIPNKTHQSEYECIMDKWEQIERDIQPELMRRYSSKRKANIPYDQWLEYCEDDRTTGSMLSTNVPCTLFFCKRAEQKSKYKEVCILGKLFPKMHIF